MNIYSYPTQIDSFNTCVKEFKKNNNTTLKKLFDLKDPQSLQLRKDFWSSYVIRSHFSRGSGQINFGQYHPILETERKNKMHNDYYESRIYELAASQTWRIFPYRDKVSSDQFYLKGTEAYVLPGDDPLKRATECLEITSLIEVHKTDDIILTQADDIYKIRHQLLGFQHLKSTEARFFLSPNYKDGHATALISILEKGTDRHLVTIYIDSQNCKNFFCFTRNGFMNAGGMWSKISNSRLSETYDRIKQELTGSKVKIDLSKKTAYILDEFYLWFNSSQDSKQISAVDDELDLIHNLYVDEKVEYRIFDRRPVAFINASNHLQTASDDKNCAIFTFNSMQACVKMLEDNGNSEVIYQHALQIGYGTDSEKMEAEQALITIFREDIKAYLPCYFNSDGTKKTESELRDFHLKQRWELGSLAASNEKYLRFRKFLPD